MADRPILFSAPMVRALLDGRKTQTRRALKPIPFNAEGDAVNINIASAARYTQGADGGFYYAFDHPRGGPLTAHRARFALGDRLWVKETWRAGYGDDYYREDLGRAPRPSDLDPETTAIEYLADGERELGGKTRVAIHMPRWASRLTLTVTDVRVQRLQDCSEADAIAEGIERVGFTGLSPLWKDYADQNGVLFLENAQSSYRSLWSSINGAGAWEANPWVVAVTFDVDKGNIDGVPA